MRTARSGQVDSSRFRLVLWALLGLACLRIMDKATQPYSVWAAGINGINVTSLADPGTGTCDEDECTLREAIAVANDTAGGDWIKIGPFNGTIQLVSPLPVIGDDLTIDATGRMIKVDGGGAFRVFSATAPLTITNLTIENGLGLIGRGGGAYFGAAAVLTDVTFRNNSASSTNGGGGAYFEGPAAVTGSLFMDNDAGYAGGAYFQSTATISGTTFIANTATDGTGGGAYFRQSSWVTNSDFVNNLGDSAGGAYFGDTSQMTSVRFIGNHSVVGHGGGAVVTGAASVLTACLFDGNSSKTNGGGLILANSLAGTSVNLIANRIWHNSADLDGGGVYLDTGASANLDNNVVAANTVLASGAGNEITLGGANAQLTGRHNTLASAATNNVVAVSAGASQMGQTVFLTNTIFDGYAVGVTAGPFSPTVVLDGVLWSSVITPTQGAGITISSMTIGNAAFTNPILHNYHLTGASAAIDKGLSTSLSVDFEGDPRSSGLGPDLGADEYIGLAPAPPQAVDDIASTLEDTPFAVNVVANDLDANNDTLVLSNVGTPNSGQAAISGTIAVIYTPTLNFNGTDAFTYTVTDNLFTSTATVSVTVLPVNDAPTISVVGDVTITTGISTGVLPFVVGDIESGGTVTVTAQSDNSALVPLGGIILGGSGVARTVTVIPAAGQAGQATVTLTVTDDHTASAGGSFVVTVYPRMFLPLVRR
jgi:CSLREA domain-containing protein